MKLKRLEVAILNDHTEKSSGWNRCEIQQSTEAEAQFFEEEYKQLLIVLIPWMSVAFHFSCMT